MTLSREQARTAVVTIRGGFAAGTWLAPTLSGALFGISRKENPAGPYLGRLFGVREAALAAEVLLAAEAARPAILRRHAAVDLADALAGYLAGRQGYLKPRAAILATAAALGTAGLGLWASAPDRALNPAAR